MKHYLFFANILFLFFIVFFSACKDDDGNFDPNNQMMEEEINDTTRSEISLEFPINNWKMASAPRTGSIENAELINDWIYNFDRARMAWYKLDYVVYGEINEDPNSSHYTRAIKFSEVFPNVMTTYTSNLRSFDLAYFPNEKGPYNFNVHELDQNGILTDPESRWAGLQRDLELNDFVEHNIKFIEFWMMDPFLEDPSNEGIFYINLGIISEDALKDGRISVENNIPYGALPDNTDTTEWAKISNYPITSLFFENDEARQYQDVGLDGLNNEGERIVFAEYLDNILSNFGQNSLFYQQAENDPANDDFRYFINANFSSETGVLDRYKLINNTEGNSIYATNQGLQPSSTTSIPDSEDLNRDNSLEQAEAFFQYKIELKPGMDVGDDYITEILTAEEAAVSGVPARWLKFQIPIEEYDEAFGGINQFTSIESIRLYLTDFEKPVVLRLVEFNLVRFQ